jgi:hypothetical protein
MDTIGHYSNFVRRPPSDIDFRTDNDLAGNGSVLTADGTVWRETVDWYVLTSNPAPQSPSDPIASGTLFRASQFLSEELPIRLAHRVQELEHLPDGLNEMPSIERVRDWYAQSFDVCCPSRSVHHKAESTRNA